MTAMTNSVENINLKQLGAEIDSLCKEIGSLVSQESQSGVSTTEPEQGGKGDYAAARKELLA
jgi:hypothetical protein